MKKVLVLLLLNLSLLSLNSQERVSDYMSGASSERAIFKSVGDLNYMLVVTVLDTLHVYQIENEESTLLRSKYYTGIGNELNFNHTDSYFLYETIDGSSAYNFTDDSEIFIPYEDGYTRGYWSVIYGDQAILSHTSQSLDTSQKYWIDLATGAKTEFPSTTISFGINKDVILNQNRIDNSLSEIVIYDKEIANYSVMDTIDGFANNDGLLEDEYYYFKGDDLKRYDFSTNTIITQYQIEDSYRSKTIITDEEVDYVVIRLTLQDFKCKLIYIDKITLNVTDYLFEVNISEIVTPIVNRNIILYDNSMMYVYNIDSGDMDEFNSYVYNSRNVLILEDRYIVNTSFYGFQIYDLLTRELTAYEDAPVGSSQYYADALKVGDTYQVNLHFVQENANRIFELDLANNTIVNSDLVPSTDVGLSLYSEFVEVGSLMYYISKENIFVIDDNTFKQLNSQPILSASNKGYRIFDDRLYWLEVIDGSTTLFYYDGVESKKHAKIPPNNDPPPFNYIVVRDYVVSDDLTYFAAIGFTETSILKYDFTTDMLTTIGQMDDDFSSRFAVHNGYIYYVNNETLSVISPSGEVTESNFMVASSSFTSFYVFKDKLLYTGDDGVYQLTGDNSELIIPIDDFYFGDIQTTGDFLLIKKDGVINEFYDGTNFYPFEQLDDLTYRNQLNEQYFVMSKSIATNTSLYSLFDTRELEYIDLPETLALQRPIALYSVEGLDMLITSQGAFTDAQFSIYDVTDGFTDLEELFTFNSYNRSTLTAFTSDENGGLILLGEHLVEFTKDKEFSLVENVAADSNFRKLIEVGGYSYFVAFDRLFGRQIFRYRVSDGLVQEEEEDALAQILLYPNPSVEQLIVQTDLTDNYTIEVLKSTGEMIYTSDDKSRSISTVDYDKGLYFVRILQDNKVYSAASFVKM